MTQTPLPQASERYVKRAEKLLKKIAPEEWHTRHSRKVALVKMLLVMAQPNEWGKFNPNHLGPGEGGGQFTTADRNGQSLGLSPGSGKPRRSALKPPSAASARGTQVAGDGGVFENREGLLPDKPIGYYTISIVPTPGIGGAGPQRVINGQEGEMYYTPDHYKTFTRIK